MQILVDWDAVRFFLAVARGGSVRAAAAHLGANHSTVLRHVAQLEAHLGAQLFERLPAGYRLSDAGEEALGLAEQMEASSNQLEAQVLGRDENLRGHLRVTMPPTLATHLLMPDLAEFALAHPEIELDILASDDPVNLTNRQADVALRVVYEQTALPLNLHGLKGPEVSGGAYITRELLAAWRAEPTRPVRWIVNAFDGMPTWAREGDIPVGEVSFRTADAGTQIAALHNCIGMTALPCFVGDADPLLARVPGTHPHPHGRLWLLTQGEIRKTKRVRVFTSFMSRRLVTHARLLTGRAGLP